jgi:hypothetical protein
MRVFYFFRRRKKCPRFCSSTEGKFVDKAPCRSSW